MYFHCGHDQTRVSEKETCAPYADAVLCDDQQLYRAEDIEIWRVTRRAHADPYNPYGVVKDGGSGSSSESEEEDDGAMAVRARLAGGSLWG
jgi:hypothetical protein